MDLSADGRDPEIECRIIARGDWEKVYQTSKGSADNQQTGCEASDGNDLSRKLHLDISDKVNREHDNGYVSCHVYYAVDDPEEALEELISMLCAKRNW